VLPFDRDDFVRASVALGGPECVRPFDEAIARTGPVTPPGSVYASEACAATLAALGQGDFVLEYVGRTRLAKNHGETRIYRLDRPADALARGSAGR